MIRIPPQAFSLGRLLITPRAQVVLKLAGVTAWEILFAHGSASWVTDEAREQFEKAVESDDEIVSFHVLANGAKIAVRTVEGHTETIISQPEELPR
jgi:hypothetical protein